MHMGYTLLCNCALFRKYSVYALFLLTFYSMFNAKKNVLNLKFITLLLNYNVIKFYISCLV